MSYVGQTAGEMVHLLKLLYKKCDNEREFIKSCTSSNDARLSTIMVFDLEVFYKLIDSYEDE